MESRQISTYFRLVERRLVSATIRTFAESFALTGAHRIKQTIQTMSAI